MLREEISYMMLEIARNAHIVDDERIDLRLMNTFVKKHRAAYVRKNANKGVPELFTQDAEFNISLVDNGTFFRLETTDIVPAIMSGKYGLLIDEIYSPYVNELPFTIVGKTHLRYSGNGKFNQNIIFVAYEGDKLLFKSANTSYFNMDKISVAAIFESPEDVPGFDVETDNYPLDQDCIEYIKNQIFATDLRFLLSSNSDEISDSTGEIKS